MIKYVSRPVAPALIALVFAAGCASTSVTEVTPPPASMTKITAEMSAPPLSAPPLIDEKMAQDREAILAMAGNYKVKFDFIETVSYFDGYDLKDRKLSGADEMVRVVEDRGDFISLQHILVVGGEQKFVVKHWRQDWTYQPKEVLTFIGGNAWEMRPVPEAERAGTWSQAVYQVDDSPRYGAVASWRHENGVSQWEPPREWRPLPRRDMTTRDDYHAVNAINRHALTPKGWVHEQDNEKTNLRGNPQILVREIAINTYDRNDDFDFSAGEDYWATTEDYWAGVRNIWSEYEDAGQPFAITIKGETTGLYMPLLGLAEAVMAEEMSVDEAVAEARMEIAKQTTTEIGNLQDRLRPGSSEEDAY